MSEQEGEGLAADNTPRKVCEAAEALQEQLGEDVPFVVLVMRADRVHLFSRAELGQLVQMRNFLAQQTRIAQLKSELKELGEE